MATSLSHPEAKRHRRILLADADAFFVSVAKLADPDGAGQAQCVIVGGTASGRGVVTSASYEAREYGVRSAMPTAQALRLCPHATVVPVPRDLCVQKSREILEVLEDFSPVVEPASIDEFYVDLTGMEGLYAGESFTETAQRIRQEILTRTGLSVSIGGGTTKLIAKMAAKVAKPTRSKDTPDSGVHIVPAGDEAEFMRHRQLGEIPMVGPKLQKKLARLGMTSVMDGLKHSEQTLGSWLGPRTGRWLYRRMRGQDGGSVTQGPRRKSISHEETFMRDITTDEDLDRQLLRLSLQVAADARKKNMPGRTITVKLRDADFTTRQASRTLRDPVATDRPILETARQLLRKLRRARWGPARLLGVALSHFPRGTSTVDQLTLFENSTTPSTETPKDKALANVVDSISDKFGRRSIVRGSEVRGRQPKGN